MAVLMISSLGACGSKKDTPAEPTDKTAKEEVTDYWSLSVEELEVMGYDGDVQAQYVLGANYDYGINDVEQNFAKAYDWYQMAAQQNDGDAWCALGYMYMNGCGVEQSNEDAIDCFNQAIDNGCDKANVGIGRMYMGGYGDEEDRNTQAFSYIQKAYNAGTIDGMYYYGYVNEYGIGVEANYELAMDSYKKTIEMTPADVSDQYAINAANTRIGFMYVDAKGVEKDDATAMDYFKAAADADYAMAQYYMGILYENGYGTDVDYDEAMDWYQAAAEQDYAPALNQIGYLYYNGYGVDVDFEQAVYYQKLSATQGYAAAQVNLGYLYENGIGVEQNYATALAYYQLAADQNYEGAKEAVSRVQKLMDEQA